MPPRKKVLTGLQAIADAAVKSVIKDCARINQKRVITSDPRMTYAETTRYCQVMSRLPTMDAKGLRIINALHNHYLAYVAESVPDMVGREGDKACMPSESYVVVN
jgi:hypothetical protein